MVVTDGDAASGMPDDGMPTIVVVSDDPSAADAIREAIGNLPAAGGAGARVAVAGIGLLALADAIGRLRSGDGTVLTISASRCVPEPPSDLMAMEALRGGPDRDDDRPKAPVPDRLLRRGGRGTGVWVPRRQSGPRRMR